MLRRTLPLLLLIALLTLPAHAEEARCLNDVTDMRIYGEHADTLLDGNLRSHSKLHKGTALSINSGSLIGGLYLQFSSAPGEWTLEAGDEKLVCGKNGYLHEYISGLSAYGLTLRFKSEGVLANVYVLSPGERPDWVQNWQPCWDKADVLLLPTHSDDDTLFFGGIIPWCIDKGARVQVAYLIDHAEESYRRNELLNALWVSGLRNYPVLGVYEDLGPEEELPIDRYEEKGVTWEAMLLRQIRLYRQFRPQVVIAHDSEGEYGHGAHKLYFRLATEAILPAGDESMDASSVARYGVWSPTKVYVHLWKENPVVIDLDEPLRSFAYKTPYELTQTAYACHESQYDFFSWYFWGAPTAAELQQYSAEEYGLYYSAVGADSSGKSFFDNLTLYDAIPGSAEEASPALETAAEETAAPEAAEAQVSTAPAPSGITGVNPRLDEIRSEQRLIKGGLAALALVIPGLLWTLAKLKSKEHDEP